MTPNSIPAPGLTYPPAPLCIDIIPRTEEKVNAKIKSRSTSRIRKAHRIRSTKKYDQANTRFVGLKLNIKTDADILAAIDGKPMQTEIKRLIRKALDTEQKTK